MRKQFLFLVSCLLVFVVSSRAQCPDNDSLRARVKYLGNIYSSDFKKLPQEKRLTELFYWLDKVNACPGMPDSFRVLIFRNIAAVYRSEGDFEKAVKYYRECISVVLRNINKPTVEPNDLITFYYFINFCYDSLNNVKEKWNAADSCLTIAHRLGAESDIAAVSILYKRIQYSYDIGDYHRCIEDATTCERLAFEYAKTGAQTKREHEVAIQYASSSLGWRVKALLESRNYAEAEKLLANKLEEYNKAGLNQYLGLIYQQTAEVEMFRGNYDAALASYKMSIKYETISQNDFNCKQNSKDLGYNIYFSHFHDDLKALEWYRKALTYVNKNEQVAKEDKAESLDIYSNIGNAFAHQGQYDSAWTYFQLGFDQIAPGINEEGILKSSAEVLIENKKIHYLTNLLINKADAWLKKYYDSKDPAALREAIRIYKATDGILNRIKLEQTEQQSKLFWRHNYRRIYEHAMQASYLLGNPEDAFYFLESGRAVLLNDQLAEQHWLNEHDINEQAMLTRQIQQLERQIANQDKSAANYLQLQNELQDKRDRLAYLKDAIKEKNPLYYQNALDSSHITIRDVREKLLKDHQALLELFEGDSSIYALLITPGQLTFKRIGKNDFDNTVRLYTEYISKINMLSRHFEDFISTAHHLYELIFQGTNLPQGRIIISPDGPYFPFEALITDSMSMQSPSYFLKDYASSYTYSARYLMNDFSKNKNSNAGSFFGMAPVQYTSASFLASLPESDISLDHIGTYFTRPHTLLTEEATRSHFLQDFPKYKIIQLYTHSSDSSDRGEPIIYFVDSSLYLSELIPENKPLTQLIVLSACETGKGKFYQGEGVFSFNRAFAAIGIPAAMINLWSVDNKSTYQLTELFYKNLSTGMPADLALQKAKLEFTDLSKQKSLPYYWAALVLAGKTESFEFSRPWRWELWVMLGLLAAILISLGWIFFKRKTAASAN